jgi:hypothetical protein
MNDDDLAMSIVYEGTKNKTMDDDLIRVAANHGWDFIGCGYDIERNKRDLAFRRSTDFV